MLAEIFMLRLELKAREGKEAAATPSPRFVPVTLPVVKTWGHLARDSLHRPRRDGGLSFANGTRFANYEFSWW